MFHIQKQDSPAELEGSSLQPLRGSASDAHDSPESIFIDQCLNDLKKIGDYDLFRTNL